MKCVRMQPVSIVGTRCSSLLLQRQLYAQLAMDILVCNIVLSKQCKWPGPMQNISSWPRSGGFQTFLLASLPSSAGACPPALVPADLPIISKTVSDTIPELDFQPRIVIRLHAPLLPNFSNVRTELLTSTFPLEIIPTHVFLFSLVQFPLQPLSSNH